MKKVTKSAAGQTKQENGKYDFFTPLFELATVQLLQMHLTLRAWRLYHGNFMPSIGSYTSIYSNWPLTVTEIYHWPVKATKRVTMPLARDVTLLIQHGVARKALVAGWYLGAYDWYLLDRDAFEQLLHEYQLLDSSFGEWKTVVEDIKARARLRMLFKLDKDIQ